MNEQRTWLIAVGLLGAVLSAPLARATETENQCLPVLPAPAKLAVDGQFDDWDLSGGIFACADVENRRDEYAVWFHAMYDADRLYLLTRWLDPTPLNNPLSSKGDLIFNGDCLQVRCVSPGGRFSHWTCYRDREGIERMDLVYGMHFDEGHVRDARTRGAAQAFSVLPGGKGYVQEMAIPWKLLLKEGEAVPKAGDRLVMTVQPNFTIGVNGRLVIVDNFNPEAKVDRVFTFSSSTCWGEATLEASGHVAPGPVRLSDGREFAVAMVDGLPRVAWTGLIKSQEIAGCKPIRFATPADGFVSLIVRDASNTVVRHLLNCAFFTKGAHDVKWDGLTDPIFRTPGQPVSPGPYTYGLLFHKGIGLKLRGFASCDGVTPWDNGPTGGWGGDHGVPSGVATDGQRIYLGWTGAEAGKALLACDLRGNVQWHNTRGGSGGAEAIAVDGGTVFVLNGASIYRVTADKGAYAFWSGTESADLALASLVDKATRADGMAARDGKVFVSFRGSNMVVVADSATGKPVKTIHVPAPGALAAAPDGRLLVVSDGRAVLEIAADKGETRPVVTGLQNATALALGQDGAIYVGGPNNQVKVFSAAGAAVREIGKPGGRPALGPWQADGLAHIAGIVLDPSNKLWVAEANENPKRVSVWDAATGRLLKEFFGPTHYGASGGAISPLDPDVMVGEGCEWRLDPRTGRGTCTGVIEQRLAGFARFCTPSNGRLYLVTSQGIHEPADYRIYERVGEGDYRFRSAIQTVATKPEGRARFTIWADANGDGQVQPNEVTTHDGKCDASGYTGWSAFVNVDLSFCAALVKDGKMSAVRLPVTGFTDCGAPMYDLAKALPMPAVGLPSLDNRCLAEWSESWINGYDLASGRLRWRYPNTFSGVHGSHLAPGPRMGLLRGAFGVVGSATLPKPVGAIWALNGNCGEWYVFTEEGFFLTQLFQGDPLKVRWPDAAVPGAILDNCPPGLGGEDFGGSLTQAKDGKVYLQAGKIGLWNVEVTGLDAVTALAGGKVVLNAEEVRQAQGFRDQALQEAVGAQRCRLVRLTPTWTGRPEADFKGAATVSFAKQDDSAVRVFAGYDATNLYVGWVVKDNTPWMNGATEAAQMYVSGDTVDLQLGADPKADKNRSEPLLGDLRVSIGNFQTKPTAVLFRKMSAVKKPKVFSSGVVESCAMDYVDVLAEAKIEVKVETGKGYAVEAALPLSALGIALADGLTLRGDFGATHGDAAGQRTRLRTHWSNQHSGIVDDAVFELKMEPKNWGELFFVDGAR